MQNIIEDLIAAGGAVAIIGFIAAYFTSPVTRAERDANRLVAQEQKRLELERERRRRI